MRQISQNVSDKNYAKVSIMLVFLCLLISCKSPLPAPVVELSSESDFWKTPDKYQVQSGDTLYSIAWRYGQDFRQLAGYNAISSPFKIYPGQTIYFSDKNKKSPSDVKVGAKNASQKNDYGQVARINKRTRAAPKKGSGERHERKVSNGKIYWSWPIDGVVISKFSNAGVGNKGLDISAKTGDAVKAAATGQVVYSGSHLVGYGKLIIIKHDEYYLSAYAHNSKLEVREGEYIKTGQKIAEAGATGTDREKLHFEIRYRGKPINPVKFLPRRN